MRVMISLLPAKQMQHNCSTNQRNEECECRTLTKLPSAHDGTRRSIIDAQGLRHVFEQRPRGLPHPDKIFNILQGLIAGFDLLFGELPQRHLVNVKLHYRPTTVELSSVGRLMANKEHAPPPGKTEEGEGKGVGTSYSQRPLLSSV